jgi:hypothetical protein
VAGRTLSGAYNTFQTVCRETFAAAATSFNVGVPTRLAALLAPVIRAVPEHEH